MYAKGLLGKLLGRTCADSSFRFDLVTTKAELHFKTHRFES